MPHRSTLFPYTTLFRSGTIRTGSFNTTADPWLALEMQLRRAPVGDFAYFTARRQVGVGFEDADRKSTRLNSSHLVISYAVFCLKNKTFHVYVLLSTSKD